MCRGSAFRIPQFFRKVKPSGGRGRQRKARIAKENGGPCPPGRFSRSKGMGLCYASRNMRNAVGSATSWRKRSGPAHSNAGHSEAHSMV